MKKETNSSLHKKSGMLRYVVKPSTLDRSLMYNKKILKKSLHYLKNTILNNSKNSRLNIGTKKEKNKNSV